MAEERRTKDIDQAALVLALLVAGWQIIDQSGAWEPINIPVGLVLLLIISAYSYPTLDRKVRYRTIRRKDKLIYLQVAAVAVGISVAICLTLAWPAQQIIYLITTKLLDWQGVGGDNLGNYTTNVAFPVILAFAVPYSYRLIHHRLRADGTKIGIAGEAVTNDPAAVDAANGSGHVTSADQGANARSGPAGPED